MKTYIGALCLVLILFSCKEKQVTFVDDIAPMVYRSCSPCHRPNQIGHFNLLTYEDVKLSSAQSLFTMQQRIMPPWPADPKYRHFVGENILFLEAIEFLSGNAVDQAQHTQKEIVQKEDILL